MKYQVKIKHADDPERGGMMILTDAELDRYISEDLARICREPEFYSIDLIHDLTRVTVVIYDLEG
jgi:hypothetical protein